MDNKELAIYDTSLAALATLEEFYSDTPITLETKDGLEEAKAIAKKFQKLRTGVEKIRTEANAEAQKHIKTVNDKAKSIQERIAPLETRYAEPIKQRKQNFESQIKKIDDVALLCEGKESAFIAQQMEWLESINPNDFAEYKKKCTDSLFTARESITNMFSEAIQREVKAEAEAQRAKDMAIDANINQMKVTVSNAMDWGRRKIAIAIDELDAMSFHANEYGDRVDEAEKVRNECVKKLNKLHFFAENEPEEQPKEKPSAIISESDINEAKNKALESLLFHLDGDVELAERLFLNIIDGKVINICFCDY